MIAYDLHPIAVHPIWQLCVHTQPFLVYPSLSPISIAIRTVKAVYADTSNSLFSWALAFAIHILSSLLLITSVWLINGTSSAGTGLPRNSHNGSQP